MSIIEEHPDFVYFLVLDDEDLPSARRRPKIRIAAALIALYHVGTILRNSIRNRKRRYLTRPELLPEPHAETPWQAILRSRNDRSFITTMGVDVATFEYILESGFDAAWYSHPIPRDDVHPNGLTRPGRRSLDSAGALGVLLHYLSGTMLETSLQQIFALVPSVLTRYVHFSLGILVNVLKRVHEARICWPSHEDMANYSDAILKRHPLVKGAFGFVDGLGLPVGVSADPEVEKATYNGWLHTHRITNVIVFAPDGCIINAKINAPGSWHDSRTAKDIYLKLLNDTPKDYFLIADTAFPRVSARLEGKIRTPLKDRAKLPDDLDKAALTIAYSNAITSARQPAEWGMRAIQGAYGRLRMPLDINNPIGRQVLLETCLRLHNLRTRLIGINQIRTVYMPEWSCEDERFLQDLYNMFFADIRDNDRVQRFYLQGIRQHN